MVVGLSEPARPEHDELHSLRRWVGASIAGAAVLVALFNALDAPPAVRDDMARLLFSPQVGAVFIIALVAVSTVFIVSIRWMQVLLFVGAGIGSAFAATPGNLTSFIWLFAGMLLAWEYGYLLSSGALKAGPVVAVFLVVWTANAYVRSTHGFFTIASSIVAVLLIATIGWMLIVVRQRQYVARERDLEQAVLTRTSELAAALSEQELLLAELHHRTKNNLQLVSSMLWFESSTIKAGTDAAAIEAAQARIQALGRVHELLYARTGTGEVDIAGFIADYLAEVSMMVESQGLQIVSRIAVKRTIRADLAIRFGLILNEIILNAMEHAAGREGASRGCTMQVSVHEEAASLVLEASDDGPGVDSCDSERVGLGVHIIESMATRLGGGAVLTSDAGTRWTVTLPLDRNESQWT